MNLNLLLRAVAAQVLAMNWALISISTAYASKSIHHYVYFGKERARLINSEFLNTTALEGAQVMYAWKDLEVGEDVYDFSPIQNDLDFLKSKGKKLFIQIQDATFDPSNIAIPEYLLKDPRYHGGAVYQYDDNGSPEGWVARRWDPAVQSRFHKLLKTLGQALDGKIEGINLQETSVGISENGPTAPEGFTPAKYRDAILSNMDVIKEAFPHSTKMQYANFMPGEWLPDDDHSYLRSLFEHAEKIGVSMGAPDLMPDQPSQRNHAYKFMHDRKGSMKVGIAVQDGNYIGRTGDDFIPEGNRPNPVPKLADFADHFLRVNYIFWAAQEPYFSHDVVPYFRSKIGHSPP